MKQLKEILIKLPRRLRFNRRGWLIVILAVLTITALTLGIGLLVRSCSQGDSSVQYTSGQLPELEMVQELERIVLRQEGQVLYGLPIEDFQIEKGEIQSGETFSRLMNGKFNLSLGDVNRLIDMAKGKLDMRDIRAGNNYTAFLSGDSISSKIEYLVYEKNRTDFVIFGCGDSLFVRKDKKDVIVEERFAEGVISSSLYGTIYDNNLNPELGARLEDIYKWSIDFFALQKGDSFRVVYEEHFIDTLSIGVGRIYGAEFTHQGKAILAVRFEQGEEMGYWDDKGMNLRKSFLRAPLSFKARVSSRFGMRIHPVRRTRSQHNGIDYACPKGTPVYAVADGTVSYKGWDRGGGGNMLKIQHAQNMASGYLHLSRYAAGISQGKRVRQGDLIAYVGSTGVSTGPHLDYRIWKSGKPINPEKLPSIPTDPIKAGNRDSFNRMKSDVLAVMKEYSGE